MVVCVVRGIAVTVERHMHHMSRKKQLSSLAGRKIRGVLYWVEQNFTQQLRLHITVGRCLNRQQHSNVYGLQNNAKTVSVSDERHLKLESQDNLVW
jgi:hypothetical protein